MNSSEYSPASRVYIYELYEKFKKSKLKVTLNKYDDYKVYNYLFLMGNDKNIKKIKKNNPELKIILCDPKQSSKQYIENCTLADLLLVCSNEQRDSFLRLNNNILVYPTYPDVNVTLKKHLPKKKLTIGYHGNKVHIEGMHDNIKRSIEYISKEKKVNLNLIYNIAQLGIVKKTLPKLNKNLTINHIQWNKKTFENEIKKIDIGIVPSLLPIRNPYKIKEISMINNLNVNYEPFDYLLRYKSSNNSGRISVFAKYGIPVITEPTQSNCELIKNGVNGFICYSYDNWRYTLDLLNKNHILRNKISKNLNNDIKKIEKKSFDNLLRKLRKFDRNDFKNTKGFNEAIEDLKKYKYQKNFTLFYKCLIVLSKIKLKIKKLYEQ